MYLLRYACYITSKLNLEERKKEMEEKLTSCKYFLLMLHTQTHPHTFTYYRWIHSRKTLSNFFESSIFSHILPIAVTNTINVTKKNQTIHSHFTHCKFILTYIHKNIACFGVVFSCEFWGYPEWEHNSITSSGILSEFWIATCYGNFWLFFFV